MARPAWATVRTCAKAIRHFQTASEKGDDRVSLRFERTLALDSSDRVPNYLALGLGDAPAGTYTVELTVTDLVSGRAASRERAITIPRP